MSAVTTFIAASLRYVAPRPFQAGLSLAGRGGRAQGRGWLGVCLWGVMEYVAVAENMG